MAANPNDNGQPLSDDDRAGAGMEIGRMLNEIDAQEKADPFPDHVDVPKYVPPELESDYRAHEYDAQLNRWERRLYNRRNLIFILALLGGAAIAGALLFWRFGGEDTTPTSGGVAAPAAQPAPAADAAQPTPTAAVDPSSAPVPPVASTAPPQVTVPPDVWRFRTSIGVLATVKLIGEDGTVRVKEMPNARGTYTWGGSDLRIAFTGRMPLDSGRLVKTKAVITCAGVPTDVKLRCRIRTLAFQEIDGTVLRQWTELKAVGRRR